MSAPITVPDWSVLISEFSPLIACDPNSGCWLWMGSVTVGGYGKMKVGGRKGRSVYIHRKSFETHSGPLGELDALHKCDTPPCCNPAHLFSGTHADNMRDAYAKGRLNDVNRLTVTPPEIIAAIKAALLAGIEGQVVAADYGVSQATVSAIKNGRRWASIAPDPNFIDSLKQPAPEREFVDA